MNHLILHTKRTFGLTPRYAVDWHRSVWIDLFLFLVGTCTESSCFSPQY